jgi:hypothetical protein
MRISGTILGSIPSAFDTVKSEGTQGWQIKQRWMKYLKYQATAALFLGLEIKIETSQKA